MRNNLTQYPGVAKFLHWAIAAMIIFNLLSGLILAYFFEWSMQFDLVIIHKQIGVMILLLVVFRIIWRLTHEYPTLDSLPITKSEKILATVGHIMLYIFMFIIPISGFFFSQSAGREVDLLWFKLPQLIVKQSDTVTMQLLSIHKYLSIAITVFISLHILGALKHQFIDKFPILDRMLPKKLSKS